MIHVPDEPALPEAQRASAPLALRFEDVAQDGRVLLDALPAGIGTAVWGELLSKHPMTELARRDGVISILDRLVVTAGRGPIAPTRPIHVYGSYDLAHTVDANGEVDRILLLAWARFEGTVGHLIGKTPRDGETVEIGRLYAEHVFTRPFGPPEARKVRKLEHPALPAIPERRVTWRTADEIVAAPDGATPLEPAAADDAPVVFGTGHTDENQHVNSLVYPRRFEEGVLRRLATLGRSSAILPRGVEIAYRKPFFAGDRATLSLRTFAAGDEVVATGSFGAGGRPHAVLRMSFEA
jgi:hypothetical protein